jgi:hypothetical protein
MHQHFCIKLLFTYTSLVELDRGKKVKKGEKGRKGEKKPAIQKKVDWQTNFQEERCTIKPSFFHKSSQVKKFLPIFLMKGKKDGIMNDARALALARSFVFLSGSFLGNSYTNMQYSSAMRARASADMGACKVAVRLMTSDVDRWHMEM